MIDHLGNRMKRYESVPRTTLYSRTPVIIRIDGKAFHTFCHGAKKPYDDRIKEAMIETCQVLLKTVQNCKLIYTQSDEISLLLIDYEKLETSTWFDNDLQKITSVSASVATMAFNKKLAESYGKWALFDARVWNLPREEVTNYFIWRQQDCRRNSVSQVARSIFSHKHLHGKKTQEMKDMMLEKGTNWDTDIDAGYRNGFCISKDSVVAAPLFKESREFVEQHIQKDNNDATTI